MKLFKKLIKKLLRSIVATDSQAGEDMVVEFLFKNKIRNKDFRYLDIGANHPKDLNNTYRFYKQGCHGVLIEPDAALCDNLKNIRPRDIVLNMGIGFSDTEERAEFYVMSASELNTFSKEQAEQIIKFPDAIGKHSLKEIRLVDLVPINNILEKYGPFNFMSIDIEGLDYQVLSKVDFAKYSPTCICVESATVKNNKIDHTIAKDIKQLLQQNGYELYLSNIINGIYIKSEYLANLSKPYSRYIKYKFKLAGRVF